MSITVPAYEQLRDLLREEIISGKIPPNTHLTIAEVANRFDVSHMPVREAFQRLQGEGLLKLQPHKGARVLSLSAEYVRDIYELRGIVEGLLMRQSIPHLTDSRLSELDDIHQQMSEAAEQGASRKALKLNVLFHRAIYKSAKNQEAQKIYERYAGLLGTLRRKFGFSQTRLQKMLQEHSDILEALRSRDESRAEALARIHADEAMKDILLFVDKSKNIEPEEK
jgi:DNA-binding GntR family transcriptional regulator